MDADPFWTLLPNNVILVAPVECNLPQRFGPECARLPVTPSPQFLPARQTHRKDLPAEIPAAAVHRSIVALTQSGTGSVRMCPPLPTRSTMAQCSSRCCKCANLDQPIRAVGDHSPARRRESHGPACLERVRIRRLPEAASSAAVSQFPSLTPSFFAPFTRRIPAASSGLSKPASAAS